MTFDNKDFKDMMVNPFDIPKHGNFYNKIKRLNHPEFKVQIPSRDLSKPLVMRYIGFAYDKYSPFMKYEKNIVLRKEAAMEHAELDKRNKWVQKVLRGEIGEVNMMIIKYIRLQQSLQFAQYIALGELFYQTQYEIHNNTFAGEDVIKYLEGKKKLTINQGDILEKMDDLYQEIFFGDATLEKDVAEHMEESMEEIPKGWPEKWAHERRGRPKKKVE